MRGLAATLALGSLAACGDGSVDAQAPLDLLELPHVVFAPPSEEEMTSPVELGTEALPALVALAPSEFRYRLALPERALLTFSFAVAEPGAHTPVEQAVRFRIRAGEARLDSTLFSHEVGSSRRNQWIDASVPLDRFAGREIWLSFETLVPGLEGDAVLPLAGVFGEPVVHDRARYRVGRGMVVVCVDGLARDRLTLYGYPRKTSPGLEALSGESVIHHQVTGSVTEASERLRDSGLPGKTVEGLELAADEVTERAIRFLRSRGDRDFLLFIRYGDLRSKNPLPPRYATAFPDASDRKLIYVDRHMERLLHEMKRMGVFAKTLVAVSSDAEQPPLVVKLPGGESGGTHVHERVDLSDLVAQFWKP